MPAPCEKSAFCSEHSRLILKLLSMWPKQPAVPILLDDQHETLSSVVRVQLDHLVDIAAEVEKKTSCCAACTIS